MCYTEYVTKENAPIIIVFNKKTDRMNLFQQRRKLKGVTESQFAEPYESDEDRKVTLNHNTPKEQQQRYIYISKSLS